MRLVTFLRLYIYRTSYPAGLYLPPERVSRTSISSRLLRYRLTGVDEGCVFYDATASLVTKQAASGCLQESFERCGGRYDVFGVSLDGRGYTPSGCLDSGKWEGGREQDSLLRTTDPRSQLCSAGSLFDWHPMYTFPCWQAGLGRLVNGE